MTRPNKLEECVELAALYSAGALPGQQVERFEAHVATCAICQRELRRSEGSVMALFETVQPVTPDPRVKAALLSRIEAERRGPRVEAADAQPNPQVWRNWQSDSPPAGLFTRHAHEGGWEPVGIPGIELRRLFVDRERNQITMLVRMAPGTAYPRHVHHGAEECYVISGDLHVGDVVLRAGDYQRADPESLHVVQHTEGGCELFLISSLTDELV